MGCQITDLLVKKDISIDDLKGKIVAIDAHLFLYQFLTTIRQQDGSLLTDSKGNITSHLTGLFARTLKLIEHGLKLVYVFDGKPPALKEKVREQRKEIKIKAQQEYEEAAKKGDVEEMKKFAARTSRLTTEMIEEAKKLIIALGLPIVEAPSEGEAQASFMVKNDDAYCVASQDADALLFGAPRLVRNLSLVGKRKIANKLAFETYSPEMVDLAENLKNLDIGQDQLITLGMLVGTDFNPNGIKGIGPKNALKIVKKFGNDFDGLFKETKWDESFDMPWEDVFSTIKNMPTTKTYDLSWDTVDAAKVVELLVEEHDFSRERVMRSLERFEKDKETKKQKGLSEFF